MDDVRVFDKILIADYDELSSKCFVISSAKEYCGKIYTVKSVEIDEKGQYDMMFLEQPYLRFILPPDCFTVVERDNSFSSENWAELMGGI